MQNFKVYLTCAQLYPKYQKIKTDEEYCIKIGFTSLEDIWKKMNNIWYSDPYYSHDLWFYDKYDLIDDEIYKFDVENIYHSIFPHKLRNPNGNKTEKFPFLYDGRDLEHEYIFNEIIDKEKINIFNRCKKRIKDSELYFEVLIDLIKNKKERIFEYKMNRDFDYEDYKKIHIIKKLAEATAVAADFK